MMQSKRLGWLIGVGLLLLQVVQAQLQTSPNTEPLIPVFFGSGTPWYRGNYNWVPDWSALGFRVARGGHSNNLAGLIKVGTYFQFLRYTDGGGFWRGGLPWTDSGLKYSELQIADFLAQLSQAGGNSGRVIGLELINEPGAWFRPMLVEPEQMVAFYQKHVPLRNSMLGAQALLYLPAPVFWHRVDGFGDYLEECYKAGLWNYGDVQAVHPYRLLTPESLVPYYAYLRSVIGRYAGEERGIVANEGNAWPGAIDPVHNPWLPCEVLLNFENWQVRRAAKYLQRYLLIHQACNVPLYIYNFDAAGDTNYSLILFSDDRGQQKTLAYYSVLNFAKFFWEYDYWTRMRLDDPDLWVLIYRKRKHSPTGLAPKEWLIVVWDRHGRVRTGADSPILPIYGASGVWYNFLGKAAEEYSLLIGYGAASNSFFALGDNVPLRIPLWADFFDMPCPYYDPDLIRYGSYGCPTTCDQSDALPLPYNAAPFYYLLDRFHPRSLPEISWRVSEQAVVRAGGNLELIVEGYSPTSRNGLPTLPDKGLLLLQGRGVNLSVTFTLNRQGNSAWFRNRIVLPWRFRRASQELQAQLAFGWGNSFDPPLASRRSIWVSVINPIECKIVPVRGQISVPTRLDVPMFALRLQSYSEESWQGTAAIWVSGQQQPILRSVSIPAGGTVLVPFRIAAEDVTQWVTIEKIQLLDSLLNNIVAEWGPRHVTLLFSWRDAGDWGSSLQDWPDPCLSCDHFVSNPTNPNGDRFKVGQWARPWRGWSDRPSCAPPPWFSLSFVAPPTTFEGGDPIMTPPAVAKIDYRFGAVQFDWNGYGLGPSAAREESVFVQIDSNVQPPIQLPPLSERALTEVVAWYYGTERLYSVGASLEEYLNNQGQDYGITHVGTAYVPAGDGKWHLLSIMLPFSRYTSNWVNEEPIGYNTEYICSNQIERVYIDIRNIFSAGPGSFYIGGIALVHYKEEEF